MLLEVAEPLGSLPSGGLFVGENILKTMVINAAAAATAATTPLAALIGRLGTAMNVIGRLVFVVVMQRKVSLVV
jgi:hypothetical protein